MGKRERYYVREHTGYAGPKLATEYMVIDRDYCHRVVRSYPPRSGWQERSRARLAAELAARLNGGDNA